MSIEFNACARGGSSDLETYGGDVETCTQMVEVIGHCELVVHGISYFLQGRGGASFPIGDGGEFSLHTGEVG